MAAMHAPVDPGTMASQRAAKGEHGLPALPQVLVLVLVAVVWMAWWLVDGCSGAASSTAPD